MRLRSSQFVFLMLLLCSVQMRGECTLHLAATVVTGEAGFQTLRHATPRAIPVCAINRRISADGETISLRAAVGTVLPVSGPVQDAMAVNSFTSFRRV